MPPALNQSIRLICLLATLLPAQLRAQQLQPTWPDSLLHWARQPLPVTAPRPAAAMVPGILIGYGAFSFFSHELQSVNQQARARIWQPERTVRRLADDISLLAPGLAVYGLQLAGFNGRHNLTDASAFLGMGLLMSGAMTYSLKYSIGSLRPDSSNRLSFPSGHSALAFAAAEWIRQEYRYRMPWLGWAAYGAATLTAGLRMYHNRHWLSDVAAGAGLGILGMQMSYWLYPLIKNKIVGTEAEKLSLAPFYRQQSLGLSVAYQL